MHNIFHNNLFIFFSHFPQYFNYLIQALHSYSYILPMKHLTAAQPLAYRFPNSDLVTSLAYVDQ